MQPNILRLANIKPRPGESLNARAPLERSPAGIKCLHCGFVARMRVLRACEGTTTVACSRCNATHTQHPDNTHALGRHSGAPSILHT